MIGFGGSGSMGTRCCCHQTDPSAHYRIAKPAAPTLEPTAAALFHGRQARATVEIGTEVARAITPISLGISSKRPPRGVLPRLEAAVIRRPPSAWINHKLAQY
jgi:hypothetical protein